MQSQIAKYELIVLLQVGLEHSLFTNGTTFKIHQSLHLKRNQIEQRKAFARDRGAYHDRFIEESINPSDTQMAEKNPNKFFKILAKKLQPIADARAREERQVNILIRF